MKKKLLGFYDYTVVLTYCGMLFAFWGIIQAVNCSYASSLLCLMMSGICDMFDGTVAATKNRTAPEKRFGIQIDSLSDLISFGVLPAVFVYSINDNNKIVALFAGLYLLCALIRLAYFNVLEEERQDQTDEKRVSYLGVPVTTIAILLPAVFLLYAYKLVTSKICFVVILIICACGFVSTLNIKKPKLIGKLVMMTVGLIEVILLLYFARRG